MPKTYFISDLHLQESNPAILAKLQGFLSNDATDADALYILGDLFELWVGDDYVTKFSQDVMTSLHDVSQKGVPIFFMPGNRDFVVGDDFLQKAGCQAISDPISINLYGRNVLLMHGDTLCTDDSGYQRFRKIIRNRFILRVLKALPLSLRLRLATWMRGKSQAYTQAADKRIMDVNQAEVMRVMHNHDINCMIHGHTHRPAMHEFTVSNQTLERIVLAAWHKQGNALVWYDDGRHELIYF